MEESRSLTPAYTGLSDAFIAVTRAQTSRNRKTYALCLSVLLFFIFLILFYAFFMSFRSLIKSPTAFQPILMIFFGLMEFFPFLLGLKEIGRKRTLCL